MDNRQLRDLATLRVLVNGTNVIFLGPPGESKTQLALALALEAIYLGIATYFLAAHDLVDDLRRPHAENRLTWLLRVYLSSRPLLIEVYIPFEPMEAHVFFQLISKRYNRGAPMS